MRTICECSQKWNWKSTVCRILMCHVRVIRKLWLKAKKRLLCNSLSTAKHINTFAIVIKLEKIFSKIFATYLSSRLKFIKKSRRYLEVRYICEFSLLLSIFSGTIFLSDKITLTFSITLRGGKYPRYRTHWRQFENSDRILNKSASSAREKFIRETCKRISFSTFRRLDLRRGRRK